jgi:hypothetical protein|tara:strand:- start:2221 stop:3408 length:1188 start_codon:yes stop_codon:yes gene_type:complete
MKKTISIIGGGTSSFLLAAFLNTEKYEVTIYEKNKTAGRKFLVAGKGGFNLTHSETVLELIERYTPNDFLKEALLHFTNDAFINWLHTLNIPTYVGTSQRVYPKEGIKPITVLKKILGYLNEKGIYFKYEHTFSGWDTKNNILINGKSTPSDYTVFSLGGGSWKITGSDGLWIEKFQKKGVETFPFEASNCAFKIAWDSTFLSKHEGSPLKNIAISCLGKKQKGEAVITKAGLEGNAIYSLSPQIREQLKSQKKAAIYIDFKPTLSLETITSKIVHSNFKNTTQVLKKELKLTNAQIDLLKIKLPKEHYLNALLLSESIKEFPLEVYELGLLDKAISTAGGISLTAVDSNFELQTIPNQFCIGEMLNWDAPTGGYLIQACASSGVYLSNYLNKID